MFEPHGRLSVSDFLRMKAKDETLKKQFIPEVVPLMEAPQEAQLWVLKAGISPEQAWNDFGIGWNEFTKRVILPMQKGEDCSPAFLARSVLPNHKPKYIVSQGAKNKCYYIHVNSDKVVVVEDMLSAMKVSMAGYSALAALGTSFNLPMCHKIAQHNTVISWMDADAAGDVGHKKLKKGMAIWDVNFKRVRTLKDPKLNSISYIKSMVESAEKA